MKKTLTMFVMAAGMAVNAAAATLVAEWNDFSSLVSTGGSQSLSIVTSGSSSVSDGVLNVVGANGPTATVDLSGAGLSLGRGITISMSVCNLAYITGARPSAIVSLAAEGQSYALLCGYEDRTNPGSIDFARNGSTNNVTTTIPAGGDASALSGDRPVTFTMSFDSSSFAAYLNGRLVASATGNFDTYTFTKLAFGSWAGDSSNGILRESVYNLAIYDGAMTADEVRELVPEPTTAALGLLAFAGLAARRRRK